MAVAMTQERLAELADLNVRTLQKIEVGQINILVTTVLRLQRALGCRWDQLLPAERRPTIPAACEGLVPPANRTPTRLKV